MTNVEKYLKDGANIDEFTFQFDEWHFKNSDVIGYGEALFRFLQEEAKPTLTEDERVILRNIDQTVYQKIGRDKKESIFDLVLTGEDVRCVEIDDILKPDLFQFIKERRRIFNRGVAR